MTIDPAVLQQRWVHAHEEDSGGEHVYRPASHPLPPSRGRRAFELRPDGTYGESAPGPTDRPQESDGTWRVAGDSLELRASDGTTHTMEVVSAEPDRLVLRR